MPYSPGEELVLQVDVTGFTTHNVCAVYGVELDGTRITGNLKNTLGAAYWKQNTDTNGLNIFTIRVPDIGACTTQELPDPNCCFIDIYQVGDPHDGTYDFFNIVFNGITYNLITDTLPPGWVFVSTPGYSKRYVVFGCDEVDTGVQIFAQVTGYDPFTGEIPKQQCPRRFCDCLYIIPEEFYSLINRVVIGGIVYTHANILVQTPSLVPGISANTFHNHFGAFWHVYVDCDIDTSTVAFQTDISGEWASVAAEYSESSCEDVEHFITKKLNCFAFEFVMSDGHGCDADPHAFSIYSEPYQCTDANCEYNKATAVIYSSYAGQPHDVLGIWTFNIGDIGDVAMNDGALGNFAAPGLRIPAIVLDLPTKVALTRNAKCAIYKSEAVFRYKLQGRKAYPPYFARMVESIALGRAFNYDGKQYEIAGETIFEEIEVPGVSAFKLNTQLQSCNNYIYHDCE